MLGKRGIDQLHRLRKKVPEENSGIGLSSTIQKKAIVKNTHLIYPGPYILSLHSSSNSLAVIWFAMWVFL